MSFEWQGFWRTLQDNTFATWFGWTLIMAIVVFPLTATIQSCWSESVREDIELAKVRASNAGAEVQRVDTIKWMVARGVHPMVARCAVLNDPAHQCGIMMNDLEEEERATIKDLLANPFVEVEVSEPAVAGLTELPRDPQEYIKGLDFGLRSPAE